MLNIYYDTFCLFTFVILFSKFDMNKEEEEPGFIQKYAVPYYISLALYAAYILIIEFTAKPSLAIALVYILQYLGRFLPKDSSNFSPKHAKYHNQHFYHMLPLIANILATWGVMVYSWFRYPILSKTTADTVFSVQAVGLIISTSLNASHELFHKNQFLCRALGFLNMTIFLFTVYPFEHLFFHHKNVGTIKDPITSAKNFNLYSYTLRVVYTAHKFTLQYSKGIFFGCMALNASYVGALYWLAHAEYSNHEQAAYKVIFFIFIGIVGFFMLQITEYIEHYGLIFNEKEEKQTIRELSSWNSQKDIVFNWLSFRFQRHSDHHMNAYKYYSTIDLTSKMPKFTFSFFEGMFLALFPPLWYYIMNPYVDEQLQGRKVEEKHHRNVQYIKQTLLFLITLNAIIGSF